MGFVSVGICTYGGAKRVSWGIRAIQNFSKDDGVDYKIVLCDDGSKDGGAAMQNVADSFGLPLIKHGTNKGISASWNSLIHHYNDTDYFIVLNDDIIVQPGWLKHMVFFLENNPGYLGAGYPLKWITEEEMPLLMSGEKVTPRDPITKIQRPDWEGKNHGLNRPGRIMCVLGAAFGMRRDNFNKTGDFDEGYKSFFEESSHGTKAASIGIPSSGLSYPEVAHVWSATFNSCPELNAGQRMQDSRKRYIEQWNVPAEFQGDPPRCPFDWTNPLYMSKIPRKLVKWLKPDGSVGEEYDEGIVEHT